MSKKLIAVAAAAALALTGLVGVAPASATSPTVTFTGSDGSSATNGPGTSSAPVLQNVPHTNRLDGDFSAAIQFNNLATGDTVRVTTSGAVKITAAETVGSADVNVATLGTQAYNSGALATNALTVYAYTTNTTTTEIKWEVSRTGSLTSGSLWIEGVVGAAYAVTNVVAPATLAKDAKFTVTYNVTDVFGNLIESSSGNVTPGSGSAVNGTWSASKQVQEAEVTSPSSTAFVLTVDGNAGNANTSVAGFAANTLSSVNVVNNAGVAAQITTLTAQVAALQAIVDRKVKKKRFNTLARKWNAAFPSQAVKLKK
jgi:hypothetical protein